MSDEKDSIRDSRVIVIGLDGATFDFILPWVKEGKLPTFKKLLEGGAWGNLTTINPPVTCPAWPSFMTGKNPGKHGVFDFIDTSTRGEKVHIVSSKSIDGKTIWQILSENGKKVGVINVPVTYPPSKVNGFMITGMLTPPGEDNYTYPQSLSKDLKKEGYEYRITLNEGYVKGHEGELLNDVLDLLHNRSKVMFFLMKNYPWDFFMTVFQATDVVSHFFRKFMDPTHPEYSESGREKYGDAILRVYQEIDGILENILEFIGDDTTLIVMSDHGHGPLYKAVNLNNFLMGEGFLNIKKDLSSRLKHFLFKVGITPKTIYRLLSALKLQSIVWKPGRETRDRVLDIFLSFSDIDWSRTKAYSKGHIAGQIFLNLKGRESQGIVEPGKEYEDVRNELINELYSLVDPEDGERIVNKVLKKEEIYSGPYIDRAPDLLVIMKDLSYIPFPLFADENSIVTSTIRGESGSHRMDGVFIAHGPGVEKGVEIKNAQILDVAPTILHLMGLKVPADMDGKVLENAFKAGYLKKFHKT